MNKIKKLYILCLVLISFGVVLWRGSLSSEQPLLMWLTIIMTLIGCGLISWAFVDVRKSKIKNIKLFTFLQLLNIIIIGTNILLMRDLMDRFADLDISHLFSQISGIALAIVIFTGVTIQKNRLLRKEY